MTTDIFKSICDEIDNRNRYNIYQLLMGRGKTSVILPLITIKYSLEKKYYNTIVCLPNHLVSYTHKEILKNYCQILRNCQIIKLKNLKRKEQKLLLPNKDRDENFFHTILIIDVESLKSFKLNTIENYNYYNASNLKQIKENSLIIFDEIDSLFNPLNSDLNYPISEDKMSIFEIIDKEIIFLFLDIIRSIIENKNYEIFNFIQEILDSY